MSNGSTKVSDLQRALLSAVEKEVDLKLQKHKTTNSQIGVVVEDPKGYEAKVLIGRNEKTCSLPEHLHTWVQKDDIVIIQDLYGNGAQKVITGKTGERQESPSLVFYDEDVDRNISGRDAIFDDEGNKLDAYGTI